VELRERLADALAGSGSPRSLTSVSFEHGVATSLLETKASAGQESMQGNIQIIPSRVRSHSVQASVFKAIRVILLVRVSHLFFRWCLQLEVLG
jgi:hypothetical protein